MQMSLMVEYANPKFTSSRGQSSLVRPATFCCSGGVIKVYLVGLSNAHMSYPEFN
jgi:hypothetical protein